MSSRLSAIWASGVVLILSCVLAGCSPGGAKGKKDNQHDQHQKVTVVQGESSALISWGHPNNIEGEKNGVTVKVNEANRQFVIVSAAKDAKVGDVELFAKNNEGEKIATITVTVREPEVDLKFHVEGRKRLSVWQNEETIQDLTVMRRREFVIGSNDAGMTLVVTGRFQGDLKLSAEVVKGGKGLTAKFDPETVKGSEAASKLKIKAAEKADLGEVTIRLTATTVEGAKASATVTIDVDVVKKKSK